MILNTGECFDQYISKDLAEYNGLQTNINQYSKNVHEVETLGITIDINLSFQQHFWKLPKQEGQK